jgi:hypothetical protein
MKEEKSNSREVNTYVLSVASLTLALFIPFSALVLKIFQNNTFMASIIISIGIPLIAFILGIFVLTRSLKSNTKIIKKAKLVSILTIVIGFLLVALNLYIFIKYNIIGIR